MPTAYLVKNVKYGSPTPKMGGWQALQTFNLGVQYALAPAKRLSAFEDSLDLERWRDPLFVEASSGICMTSAQNQDPNVGGSRLGIGYESSVSVGKWFAPVAGFRGTLTRRSTEWGYYEWGAEHEHGGNRFIGTEDNWSFGYSMDDERIGCMTPVELASKHGGKVEECAVTPAQHSIGFRNSPMGVGKSWTKEAGEPELNLNITHDH